MKSITLHPLSLAIGFALAAGTLGLLAAQSVGGSHAIPTKDIRVLGYVPAEQWTFVRTRATNYGSLVLEPYQVPMDKSLVVTDWEWSSASGPTPLVNGQFDDEWYAKLRVVAGNGAGYSGNSRAVFGPGTLLSWTAPSPGTGSTLRLWGYLEPVR